MRASHWIKRASRDTEPGIEMRFHGEWSHSVFSGERGHQVVLGPIGIDLGTFPTLDEAIARAEDNARTRALNTLKTARDDISRASLVLAALSEPTDGSRRGEPS